MTIQTEIHNRSLNSAATATFAAMATSAAVLLSADPAMAQAVAAGAMPTGRFGSVAVSLIAFISITIGIIMVTLGLLYGLFQFFFREGGVPIILKSVIGGALVGTALALAIWVVGSTPTTATLPMPGGIGG